MADADVALAELGPATVVGRGLGAYVALLIAGARPTLVRGRGARTTVRASPAAGRTPARPSSSSDLVVDRAAPDPWALVELARDVRPPDYATSFARQATQLSGLDVAGRRVRPVPAAVARGGRSRARRPRHDAGRRAPWLRGAA